MKVLRTLKPKKTLQNDFFVADTETGIIKDNIIEWQLEGRPEKFIFGCIVGKNYRKHFFSLEEMKAELADPIFKNKVVFFHNAEYDLNVLYGNIFKIDPTAIFNGKFITCTNGVCRFADSMNIYKTSVKEIGKMIGENKIGMNEGSYQKSNWNNKKEYLRDIEGCYKDCEIVYEALFRIFEEAGDIKITQASLAMSYYRRFHQPYNIEHNENTAFFFDSYFGGRTECFKMGNTHASVIDENSMYPDKMKKISFPNPKKLKVSTSFTIKYFLRNVLFSYEGLAYCTIKHHATKYGFLPYKHEGKLLFPVGTFSGCWNFNELRFALDHKAITIVKLDKVVFAPAMPSPFVGYVDFLFKKKATATNDLDIYTYKLFLNALYGKFCQRITEETIYIEDIEKSISVIKEFQRSGLLIKIQPFNESRKDCFLILHASKKVDASFCIPSFGSYITSAARIDLLQKLLELDKNKPVYCDTDSIFFEIFTPDIKTGNSLGEWKLENKLVTEIKGLKYYKYFDLKKDPMKEKEITRVKGVPKTAIKIGDIYSYSNLMKTKEGMRRNTEAGILTKRTKKLYSKYTKRIVFSDGETAPIEII